MRLKRGLNKRERMRVKRVRKSVAKRAMDGERFPAAIGRNLFWGWRLSLSLSIRSLKI